MIPTLFPADYVDTLSYSGNWPEFPLHGTVDLIDCIECVAEEIEDDTSEWELAITYPQGGYGFDELALNKIIVAKANDHQSPQAFRIYSIEKNISKTVTVKAQHISYDMVNIPVKPFTATSASSAVTQLRNNTIYGTNWKLHHFYIDTDVTQAGTFKAEDPQSMRALLLDGEDSIKGSFGGDLIFDNYHISLRKTGGEDRNITITYGVDLIDMTQEENNSEMVTGIFPYYKRSSTDPLYETSPFVYGSVVPEDQSRYPIPKIESVDLTEYFPDTDHPPNSAAVTTKAHEWVAKEQIGEPEISLTVQYATLGQDVRIHDAIEVYFPGMGIKKKAKIVKYKYNVLLERCEEIEVGHAKDSSLFSLMDASRLRKGLVPPARIQNGSISNDKIANGGVGKGKIAPAAVGGYNIERKTINHNNLTDKDSPEGPAVRAENLNGVDDPGGAAVTNEKIGRGVITGDKIDSKQIQRTHIAGEAVGSDELAKLAVKEGNVADAAVAWAKLKTGSGQPATKINALETDMAYVNKLFASSAQIDYIRVKAIYANTASIGGLLYAGETNVDALSSSGITVRNSGNIRFKNITFNSVGSVQDMNGNFINVIASS